MRWWPVCTSVGSAPLTELSQQQADYINVPVEGPFNPITTAIDPAGWVGPSGSDRFAH